MVVPVVIFYCNSLPLILLFAIKEKLYLLNFSEENNCFFCTVLKSYIMSRMVLKKWFYRRLKKKK